MNIESPGTLFRKTILTETPLQIVGAINPICALLAQQQGFRALYLSGAGVANASYGLPDLGITNLNDVLTDVRRITSIVNLPLLVDIDTGWGTAFNIERTVREMIQAGAAAVHIEDQVQAKRCGHRPGKALVDTAEMQDRIKAAVQAKTDPGFVIMARTDALATEGLDKAIERVMHYIEAGADMIFFEGATELEQYAALTQCCSVPVLANITEFGVTPLFTVEELAKVGVKLILYPLTAFRAMNFAAKQIYQTLRQAGSQKACISMLQTRKELYDLLQYEDYEKSLDALLAKGN